MYIRNVMSTPPVVVPPETPVTTTARLMVDAGVGAVVVVSEQRVVGIVTDRDLVGRVLAARRPVNARIDSVMTAEVVTIDANEPVDRAYEAFRLLPFRRLPVLDPDSGTLVGLLSVDDLMLDVSRRVADLAGPVGEELLAPTKDAAVPAPVTP